MSLLHFAICLLILTCGMRESEIRVVNPSVYCCWRSTYLLRRKMGLVTLTGTCVGVRWLRVPYRMVQQHRLIQTHVHVKVIELTFFTETIWYSKEESNIVHLLPNRLSFFFLCFNLLFYDNISCPTTINTYQCISSRHFLLQ